MSKLFRCTYHGWPVVKVTGYIESPKRYHNPCACCGMTYNETGNVRTNLKNVHKGLRLILSKIGEASTKGRQHVYHVKTKNGFVTVGVRVPPEEK